MHHLFDTSSFARFFDGLFRSPRIDDPFTLSEPGEVLFHGLNLDDEMTSNINDCLFIQHD